MMRFHFQLKLLFVLVPLGISSPVFSFSKKKTEKSAEETIRVVTFNVENLFDTKHDPGKEDQTFLPKSQKITPAHQKKCNRIPVEKWKKQCLELDWNEEVYRKKVHALAKTLEENFHDHYPDIIILQEVENENALRDLNESLPKEKQYPTVILVEGSDARGIDQAVLSKYKLTQKPVIRKIPFREISLQKQKDTRGFLEVHLKTESKQEIIVYAVHLPAPFHPKNMRDQSLEALKKMIARDKKDKLVIAGGDFNITKEEDQMFHMPESVLGDSFLISHRVGCKECLGTNYYPPKDSWSFLDILMMRKHEDWTVNPESVQVMNRYEEQNQENSKKQKSPKSFDEKTGSGVSDHYPIMMDIVRK